MFSSRFLIAFALLATCAALAQKPQDLFEKAPPDVDQALRARVAKFYQAYVDGKFRAADEMVAEDSKDAFFAANKQKFRGFEIAKIRYTDNFTRASVVVSCDTDFVMALAAARLPVKMPVTTLWKLENGNWFWYVPPQIPNQEDSPWGMMKGGPDEKTGLPGSAGPPLPAGNEVQSIWQKVKINKGEIILSSDQPGQDEVTVTNNLPGSVKLSLNSPKFYGLTLTLDKTDLRPSEVARLKVEWKPSTNQKKPVVPVSIEVMPTGQTIPLLIKFSVPSTAGTPPASRAQIPQD